MTQHTQGPWKIDGCNPTVIYIGNSNTVIAGVFTNDGKPAEANAHLIASAPELLNDLKWILEFTEVVQKIVKNKDEELIKSFDRLARNIKKRATTRKRKSFTLVLGA